MPVNPRLMDYLSRCGVRYTVYPHREVFTAREVAEAIHVPGRQLAKSVVLRDARPSYFIVALPAARQLDPAILALATGRHGLQIATEAELTGLFPDCDLGSAPPFGHLYGLATYVDRCVLEGDEIYFKAGNHREIVGMWGADFQRLVRAERDDLCFHETVTLGVVEASSMSDRPDPAHMADSVTFSGR